MPKYIDGNGEVVSEEIVLAVVVPHATCTHAAELFFCITTI